MGPIGKALRLEVKKLSDLSGRPCSIKTSCVLQLELTKVASAGLP